MSKPTFGSLFAGIGGIDLGLERAGFECKWQVEIDPYCQAVLRKHWPNVPKFGDVRELTNELSPVEIVVGGFPCQDVSDAGQRAGISGARSGLWGEMVRTIRVVRPCLALVENVAGLLARGMGTVLGDMAESGYDAEWDCISACELGAPHPRNRVFIMAYPDGVGRGAGTAFRRADSGRASNISQNGGTSSVWGWSPEPPVCGVAHGVPSRVDRLRALGNAVVPQVAEWVGERIIEAMNGHKRV